MYEIMYPNSAQLETLDIVSSPQMLVAFILGVQGVEGGSLNQNYLKELPSNAFKQWLSLYQLKDLAI